MSKIRCPKCKKYYENYGMLTTKCPHCKIENTENTAIDESIAFQASEKERLALLVKKKKRL